MWRGTPPRTSIEMDSVGASAGGSAGHAAGLDDGTFDVFVLGRPNDWVAGLAEGAFGAWDPHRTRVGVAILLVL